VKCDFPDHLLQPQQDLNQVRADLWTLFETLPYWVEPLEAWVRHGYWLENAKAYPASPGWSEEEKQQVVALRDQERGLATTIITHPYWGGLTGPERPAARDARKHALEEAAGQETEA
jgi:hypothetical protein